jgi:sugar phosphate isomerase/epimerase
MISVSSPVFSLIDFEMALDFINQHFDAWEIVGEGGHNLPRMRDGFLDITSSYEMEFSAHAPISGVNIGSLIPDVRERAVEELIKGLEAASQMGMDTYTFHPGLWSDVSPSIGERVYQAMRDSISRIDDSARDLGVRAALENMPGEPFVMCDGPEDLFHLLEGTDIGICFDVGHAHLSGTLDQFLDLSPRFSNVHIHDNHGQSDEHLQIGNGRIDFRRVLEGLGGYQGRIVIEARSLNDAIEGKRVLKRLMES